jgi:hypothetical protein
MTTLLYEDFVGSSLLFLFYLLVLWLLLHLNIRIDMNNDQEQIQFRKIYKMLDKIERVDKIQKLIIITESLIIGFLIAYIINH